MKDKTTHLYVDSHERKLILHSLVELKKRSHTARQIFAERQSTR